MITGLKSVLDFHADGIHLNSLGADSAGGAFFATIDGQSLTVRVAGDSAPFTCLWPDLKEEIIARTGHGVG